MIPLPCAVLPLTNAPLAATAMPQAALLLHILLLIRQLGPIPGEAEPVLHCPTLIPMLFAKHVLLRRILAEPGSIRIAQPPFPPSLASLNQDSACATCMQAVQGVVIEIASCDLAPRTRKTVNVQSIAPVTGRSRG